MILYVTGLDEFTSKLTADDARVLVDLLKLAVAGRVSSAGGNWAARDTLANILTSLGKANPQVNDLYFHI